MPIKSLSEIRQLFKILYPEQNVRERCLSLLAESIKNAHDHAPDEWVVVVPSNRVEVRLTVGHLVTFAPGRGKIWMALDLQQLEIIGRYRDILDKERSWQWKIKDYQFFKLVLSRNEYYLPDADPSAKLLPIIWELNSTFVKRIGELKRKLRPWSRAAYQPAVLEFLRQELKQSIPEPKTDFALPEEISVAEDFHEGSRKRISVNAYERNQGARGKCLEHYGVCCAICIGLTHDALL